MKTVTPKRIDSLRDKALAVLRQAIVHLKYSPGSVVSEAELIATVGLGRTPVREAVGRLEQEGFVAVLPRKGILITPITLLDLQTLCELRMELEGLGARLAAERRTPAQLEELQTMFKGAPALIAANDLPQLLDLDRDFHMLLAQSTKNRYLEETLSRLYSNSLRYWYISFSHAGFLDEVLQEHEVIIASVAEQRGQEAEAAMRHHVRRFKEKVIQSL
ncbi:MAG: GntR family transcriptional regulator [Candidatus Deferrimicrobium sp.]